MDELFLKAVGADTDTAKRYAHPLTLTNKENVLNAFLDTTAKLPNGEIEYLLSFDDEDLNEIGVDTSTVANADLKKGIIPYKKFKEQGFYQARVTKARRVKRDSGLTGFLNEVPVFVANNTVGAEVNHFKKTNPISTETGFYEIFSMNLANYYKTFWYDAPELGPGGANAGYDPAGIGRLPTDRTNPSQLLYPIAAYRPQPDGYEVSKDGATYYNGTVVSAAEFPLQYIALHPFHRGHSTRTDNKHILELFSDVLFINPETAVQNGVGHGDTVILTSSMGGKIMRRVAVFDTVMPGVVISTEGGTLRHLDDEATTEAVDWTNVIDYGGAANSLTASHRVGQAHQAYNTVIVKMEKLNGKLMPQYKWEPDLPDKVRTVLANYYKQN
jgi:anaerobic selenocysteine-containing dehydrogenase